MRNKSTPTPSSLTRQNSGTLRGLLLIPAIALLVSNLLVTEPAQAKNIVLSDKSKDPQLVIKTNLQEIHEQLVWLWLTEWQIADIESLHIQIEADKKQGFLPKDFQIVISNEVQDKGYDMKQFSGGKNDELTLPETVNYDNYNQVLSKIFDLAKTKKTLANNRQLSDWEKKELYEDTKGKEHYYFIASLIIQEKYWDKVFDEWLELFNKLKWELKHRDIINYQRLFETTFSFVGVKYVLEKDNHDDVNEQSRVRIYIAHWITKNLLKWNSKFLHIVYANSLEWLTPWSEWLLTDIIVWDNWLSPFWISTDDTVKSAVADYKVARIKWIK